MGHGRQPEVYVLAFSTCYARPMSYILILALTFDIFKEKGVIRIAEEEKFRIPFDVRGSKTSVLRLSNMFLHSGQTVRAVSAVVHILLVCRHVHVL